MNQIDIGPGEHILAVGKTGSGKTRLLQKKLLPLYDRAIIWSESPKKDDWIQYTNSHATTLQSLKYSIEHNEYPILFEPFYTDEKNMLLIWSQLCKIVLRIGDIALFNDEITDVSNVQSIASHHFRLMRKGRKYNVSHVCASQRPQIINSNIWTQSRHKFIFNISRKDTVLCSKYLLPESLDKIIELPDFYYIYTDERRYYQGYNDK